MKNFITIGKFVFAFLLLCSSSVLAYDQQYQPGDTGPNGGVITQVTVTSTDGDPVVTTVGDQQTTTIETTYVEEIIEATTNEVVTTQITQVETREVSGTTTTGNVLEDIDPSYSGDVHNYGSGTSVSETMLIFGPNGGTVTSEFNLNSYMTEEQWQGGFDIDAQADMLNCFNTQTTFQCESSVGGPADSFTMTITVTDGSETYESVTTHTIDNGPINFQSYSTSLTVPQNNLTSAAKATIQGYGYDVGNYDLSDGTRSDGQPTYLGPLLTNPSVTITHNLYQTVIQQIEQQITNTVTEYITTQLTATESASTTITIENEEETTIEDTTTDTESTDIVIEQPIEETEETIEIEIVVDTTEDTTADDAITTVDDDDVEDDTVTETVEDVVETIIETITETIEDQDQPHENNNNNDNNNNAGDWSEPEPDITEITVDLPEIVEPEITEITVELPEIVEDTEVVIVEIEEEPKLPEVTQKHIDNMLDTIEVAVSDGVGDIINMTVDLKIDDTGSVQVEIVSIDMTPEMGDMGAPMPQPVSTNDMASDTSMAPPAMEAPNMEPMPEMMPEMPQMAETGPNLASNTDMPDVSAPVDMPAMDSGPQDMQSAVSEAVTEMASIDAAPSEPMESPQSGDLVIGESSDSPTPVETEAPQQQTAEAQPQSESRAEPQAEPEPQSQSEPEPTSEPEPQQTAEQEPQQQESESEQTAEAQPEQESEPEQQSEQETVQETNESEPQEQETASNESKNDSKDSEQKTEQKAESKQTKTKTTEQKKQEMKQKIAQKILDRVLQNQNVTMAQVDATRLTLMTSLADTAGFSDYQSAILKDRTTWYADTQIYDLPQMVDPFADILTGAQNMQMDSLIDSQYGG
jgi:hypothetical protein